MYNYRSSISYEKVAIGEDLERIARAAHYKLGRLYYSKHKTNDYICYCSKCGTTFHTDKEHLEQMKEAGKCFKCAQDIKVTVRKNSPGAWRRDWICIKNEMNAWNGYELIWRVNGGVPEIDCCNHVLHKEGGTTWLYRIVKNFAYSLGTYWDKNKWYWRKERKSLNPYIDFFTSVEYCEDWMMQTRKEYYKSLNLANLKSNQQTFIRDGIYNQNQLKYIAIFDLNHPEEVHRYKKYIKIHSVPDYDGKLNVHYLDYLAKDGKNIRTFFDYAGMLSTLGEKLDKPKDLDAAHDLAVKKIDAKKNAQYAKAIEELHDKLLEKEWQKDGYTIKVFTSYEEMVSVGEILHNCIGKYYVKPYATYRTAVYYGTKDGEITFALEVANKKLIQLRADHNKPVDKGTEKFVGEWCRRYNYAV